jgi:hypothetical protein
MPSEAQADSAIDEAADFVLNRETLALIDAHAVISGDEMSTTYTDPPGCTWVASCADVSACTKPTCTQLCT